MYISPKEALNRENIEKKDLKMWSLWWLAWSSSKCRAALASISQQLHVTQRIQSFVCWCGCWCLKGWCCIYLKSLWSTRPVQFFWEWPGDVEAGINSCCVILLVNPACRTICVGVNSGFSVSAKRNSVIAEPWRDMTIKACMHIRSGSILMPSSGLLP